ncbi:MAG TPA: L,D-transpeptidase family protein [Solirubrobacterales bacterium]|nr:L,D-transpeptidase family protein [Solirubrobacterales bacterium]
MLIEDRSTTPDFPPEAPRRWPKRLLVGGVMVLLLGAVAAFIVSAFALSGATIEEDGSSLGKVSTDTFGGSVESVTATAVKSGADVPVKMQGDRIVPTTKLHPGEEVAVEVKVKRPSVIGTLAGGEKTLTATVTAPVANLEARWLNVKDGKNPRLHFSRPVSEIVYGTEGEKKHRRFDQPRRSVTLGPQPPAGQLQVSWAAMSWEHPGKAKTVTWFPATGVPTVAATPTAGATISASTPIEVTFSKPVKKILGSERPKLSPEVDGKWTQPSPHTLRFVPAGFGVPLAADLKVELPEAMEIVQADGSTESSSEIAWEVPAGSQTRLRQMLAELGYLPYKFTGEIVAKTPAAQVAAATTETPNGHFTPRWSNTPSRLKEIWANETSVLVEGALMSYQERNGLEVDGVAGPEVWEAIMKSVIAGDVKPEKGAGNGYSWSYVSEASPETVGIWHNGKWVLKDLAANTGIPGAETELGTHNVYLRYEETTMSGENPDGSKYVDPGIMWVSYFFGGDALHAFDRASYGSPQSLGCVEMPLEDAAAVWPYTPIGTPVTVDPA